MEGHEKTQGQGKDQDLPRRLSEIHRLRLHKFVLQQQRVLLVWIKYYWTPKVFAVLSLFTTRNEGRRL